ncbi:DUF3800 domain-containing protein [Saccharibacillus brassicae]|uniref:DUF3800 domain-containing protein n=1 Tax=Saccharibacillus brassicae TaxID=2583377 RepID=A0A4Y6UUM6_SACBS|nr:DUF3800 domain-containing protein [Saccharibacillus brassicae]QDH21403.1 hypothetical protein FFV09_11475 [Saccharibacillus brassicae]
MIYNIYFDEANKIDQPGKENSYYGAYGGSEQTMTNITQTIQRMYEEMSTKSELHFREYNHDQYLKKYFKVLHYIINQNVNINIFIVDNTKAHSIAQELNLTMMELRNLFYIKIPERLFYGVTRHLSGQIEVNIKIDRNDEYDSLRLHSKIKEQMNAHSVYRSKTYKIASVESEESHESIPLQIIDTFMGIVVFLMEQSYMGDSNTTLIKSDLIYRFLSEGSNINRFLKQIKLYSWNGNENLSELSIGDYVSQFMVYKSRYDVSEIAKLQAIMWRNPDLSAKEYRKLMGYPNTLVRMLLGYKDEVEGRGRNYSLID